MFEIAKFNKISQMGLARFGEIYKITEDPSNASGILVRSQDLNSLKFSDNLLAISRAGAGVNNIPIDRCSENGIAVFNTPGANANAVKELVIAAMVIGARNLYDAIKYSDSLRGQDDIKKTVEKNKSRFKGSEIAGKTLGIMGLGAIGTQVANAALSLGMRVKGYDAFLNVKNALKINSGAEIVGTEDELVADCDFISIHIPQTPETRGMINANLFSKMKQGTILLNFSRDTLVNEDDLLEALNNFKIKKYVTDFTTANILDNENVYCLPHLGASTIEAEDNCAIMAADELKDYIENGNITNSVNLPAVNLGPCKNEERRIAIITIGDRNPVKTAVETLGDNIEINAISGATRGDLGYVLISTNSRFYELPLIPGAVKVRVMA